MKYWCCKKDIHQSSVKQQQQPLLPTLPKKPSAIKKELSVSHSYSQTELSHNYIYVSESAVIYVLAAVKLLNMFVLVCYDRNQSCILTDYLFTTKC